MAEYPNPKELHYKATDEVYTPPNYFEALGLQFDLDVCAPKGGLPWIPTKQSYCLADDGLSQDWNGLVWMNPPYSKAKPWLQKFIEHGNGVTLIVVSKSISFQALWNTADAICLMPHNFKFVNKDLSPHGIQFAVASIALGKEAANALHNANFNRVR